jgi:hypothetical protein
MRSPSPKHTFLVGLCVFLTSPALAHLSVPAAKGTLFVGFLAMVCAGSVAGLRQLLALVRVDAARCARRVRVHRRLWLWRARHATAAAPLATLAWHCGFVVYVVVMVGSGLDIVGAAGRHALDVASCVLLCVALVDLTLMGYRMMRWAWGQAFGKWIARAMAALLTAIAWGMARQTLVQLTGEDPTKFPLTLGLVGVLYSPLAWATIAAGAACVALVPTMLLTFYRFKHANLALEGDQYPLAKIVTVVRPVLLCLAVAQVGMSATPPDLNQHAWIKAAATVMLVKLDFLKQPACGRADRLLARVGESRYLMVDEAASRPTIRPFSCPSSVGEMVVTP